MASSLSQITIYNSALLKIGADLLTSTQQNSRACNVLNTLYALRRDQVMRESPWRFALKDAQLFPNSTTPLFQFTYAFDIPNDCLRPWTRHRDEDSWAVRGNMIYSNTPEFWFTYIYQNTDETSWDPSFGESLAWRLAADLALALTESLPLKQEMENSYKFSLGQARAANAILGTVPKLEADIWSLARKGFRYSGQGPTTGQSGDEGPGPDDYNQ